MNSSASLSCVMLTLALATTGCGSDNKTSTDVAKRTIATGVRPPAVNLVTKEDIAREPPSSARRALLQHHLLLQSEALDAALDSYDESLVRAIGPARIIEAFKAELSGYRAVKPKLRPDIVVNGQTVVSYEARDATGRVTVRSMTWRRKGARWLATYDSFLDAGLRDSAQTRTQLALDPTAQKADGRAIAAGYRAGSIQSDYVARRRRAEAERAKGR
jgi:hypothetical protein